MLTIDYMAIFYVTYWFACKKEFDFDVLYLSFEEEIKETYVHNVPVDC